MTKVILTRHGETYWNLEGRVQGILNSSLTQTGIVQAKKLAKRLRCEGVTHLFTSDLERAVATAKILQDHLNIDQIVLSKELREFSFGEWEGKIWNELRREYPDLLDQWDRGPHLVQIPGGERMKDVGERAWSYVLSCVKKHPGKVLCFVTHGITLQLIVKKALGIPLEEWQNVPWQYNTAVNIFEFGPEEIITPVCLADISHLKDS